MTSIITAFQTQAIRRVKIGVGQPADGDVAAFVLRRFSDEQRPVMAQACEAAVEIVLQMVTPPRAHRGASRPETPDMDRHHP